MTLTCSAGIRVTTQIANALTTTRMMKRIVRTSLARATDGRGGRQRSGGPGRRPDSATATVCRDIEAAHRLGRVTEASDIPIRVRPEIAALPPYKQGRQAGVDAFKLSSNENPFEPLPGVLEAVQAATALNRYPDASAARLRRATRRAVRRRHRLGPHRGGQCLDPRAAGAGDIRPRRRGDLRVALVRGVPVARGARRRDRRAGAPDRRRATRLRRDGRRHHRPDAGDHRLQPEQPDRARPSRRRSSSSSSPPCRPTCSSSSTRRTPSS